MISSLSFRVRRCGTHGRCAAQRPRFAAQYAQRSKLEASGINALLDSIFMFPRIRLADEFQAHLSAFDFRTRREH